MAKKAKLVVETNAAVTESADVSEVVETTANTTEVADVVETKVQEQVSKPVRSISVLTYAMGATLCGNSTRKARKSIVLPRGALPPNYNICELEIRHNKHGIKPADYSLKLDSTLVVTDPSFIKAVESASHKGLCTFVDGFVTDPAKGHEEVAKVTFAINASKKCSPSDWDLRAKNKDYQDAFVYECKVVYTGTNVRDLTQLGMSQEAAVIASKSIEHRVFHHHSEAVQS